MRVKDIRSVILKALEQRGLQISSGVARRDGEGLYWLVEVVRSPRTGILEVDLGCMVDQVPALGSSDRVNHCPLSIVLRKLPLVAAPEADSLKVYATDYGHVVSAVVDLEFPLSDNERRHELGLVMDPLVGLLNSSSSLKLLRKRYLEGMFRSAFIHRELRNLLDEVEQGRSST